MLRWAVLVGKANYMRGHPRKEVGPFCRKDLIRSPTKFWRSRHVIAEWSFPAERTYCAHSFRNVVNSSRATVVSSPSSRRKRIVSL